VPAHELVNPNFHVVLVHFPIGLLVTGTLIELFSFLGWQNSGFRVAGRWMIGLGALLAIPTALSGIYALSDVVRADNPAATANHHVTWSQARASSPVARDAEAWEMLERHAYLNGGVTALLAFVVVVWLSGSDSWRRTLHLPLLILLLAGVGAAVVSAWYGGEVVYRKGVGVEGAAMAMAMAPTTLPTDSGSVAATTGAAAAAATLPLSATTSPTTSPTELTDIERDVARVLPPMQAHVILAGFAVAIALAAMGASLRAAGAARAAAAGEPVDELSELAAAYGARPVRPGRGPEVSSYADAYAAAGAAGAARNAPYDVGRTPSARLWLLTFLLALLTAGIGYWMLIRGDAVQNLVDFAGIWNNHIKLHERRMFHVIAGGAIVVLPLLLALLARVAPRARGLLFLVSLLLIVAVAAQVWLGTLMLWDSHEGPARAFNP